MAYPHQPENIKVCPGCSANLINTARHCAVCGYRFTDGDPDPLKGKSTPKGARRLMAVTVNLPVLLGAMIFLLAFNILVILGLHKRDQTKALFAAEQATSTYLATTYVSPTPLPTATRPPALPTDTPLVDIEYVVVEGDSCLSIAKKFNLYLDSLLRKNDIDCSLLKIGTVLKIPRPTATPEPTGTAGSTPFP